MSLEPGTRLGSYEIVSVLGAGGMGEVYRARDTRLDRTVAIKVLATALAGDPQLGERFEREARAISALDHPNICALYDVGEQDGTAFLVMQYLDGETLAERLLQGPLPADQALRHAAEIADALSKAHRQGIVHRDLKPGNVMLTKQGAKLLDFGLAKMGQAIPGGHQVTALPTTPANLTARGTILGTFQYMAPEQLEGGEADARSDIFAFGAVFFEMLTGRRAFEGKSQAGLISAIMSADPPSVSSVRPNLPASLDYVIGRCLAKDPDDRWQTARDLLAELKRAGAPASSFTPSTASGQGLPAPAPAAAPRWSRLVWAASTIAALAVLAIAAYAVVSRSSATPAEPLYAAIPLDPADGLGGTFTFSPDGRQVVFVGRTEGTTHLYLRALDKPTATLIPGTENVGVDGAAFSPDGKWLAFRANRTIRKVSIDGGPVISIGTARYSRPAWGPNDTLIYNAVGHAGLSQIPSTGGTPKPLTELDAAAGEMAHDNPVVLPGGRVFLYHASSNVSGDTDPLVVAQAFDGGARKPLFRGRWTRVLPTGELLFVRGTTLMKAGFDEAGLATTGDASVLMEDVVVWGQSALVDPSSRGSLAYFQSRVLTASGQSGGVATVPTRLVKVSPTGTTSVIDVPEHTFSDPRVSPDGTRVVVHGFETSRDNWVADLQRGTLMRLTFEQGEDETPVWSPDGRWIAYTSTRAGQERAIYRRAADGSGPEELLWSGAGHLHIGGYTPDGRTLVVSINTGDSFGIATIALDDGKLTPILSAKYGQYDAALSRDGKWLAYTSDESGRPEVFVRSFPSLEGRWQVSTDGGSEPVWARDGRTLHYRGSGKIMAVRVTPGATFIPSPPQPIFDDRFAATQNETHTCYDTMPDGSFLMVQETAERRSIQNMRLILNWLPSLSTAGNGRR